MSSVGHDCLSPVFYPSSFSFSFPFRFPLGKVVGVEEIWRESSLAGREMSLVRAGTGKRGLCYISLVSF